MKSFGLENVKAFKDTKNIELAPITIFVGQNSCGKSSFIRFPAVLSQTILNNTSPICLHSDQNELIDYGSFNNILHNENPNSFSFKFSYSFDKLHIEKLRLNELLRSDSPYIDDIISTPTGYVSIPRDDDIPDLDYEDTSELMEDYEQYPDENEDEKTKHSMASPVELTDLSSIAKSQYCDEKGIDDVKIVNVKIEYSRDQVTNNIVIISYDVKIDGEDFFRIVKQNDFSLFKFSVFKCFRKGEFITLTKPREMNVKLHCKSLAFEIDYFEILANLAKEMANLDEKQYLYIYNELKNPDTKFFYRDLCQIVAQKYDPNDYNYEFDSLVEHNKAFQYAAMIQNAITHLLIDEMKAVNYIGPFRSNPERVYRRSETIISNVGNKGEHATKMLINDSIGNKEIYKTVSDWFVKAFKYEIDIEPLVNRDSSNESDYYQIFLKDTDNNIKSSIMDVGYGISQVLPIVTQVAHALFSQGHEDRIDEIFIIEQPELHLHPKAQSKLADLFAEATSNTMNNHRKFLIETHSEHFIHGLQILIADPSSSLTNDNVKFYSVEKENDESIIREMKTNEYGQFIERWPKGFFDEAHIMSKKFMDIVAQRKSFKEVRDD